MKTENIVIGQVFKNYKAVCEWLDVAPADGNSKNAHIKEFERYCKYHKEGNKYIIDEVYDEPLNKVDNRVNNKGGNNNKYFDLMDNVIIDLLKHGDICESQKNLFCNKIPLFQMNEYNKYYKVSLGTMANNYKTTNYLTKTYYDKMLNITKKCFLSSLNRLKKQGIINYEIGYMVMNYYGGTEYTSPNDEMFSKIKQAEAEVYKDMEIKPYDKMMNKNINKEFAENVVEILYDPSIKQIENVGCYWKTYYIELTDNANEIIDLDSIKSNVEELRKQLIINLHTAIEKYKVHDNTPYTKSKYRKDILFIDRKIWIDAEKLIDDKNKNFQMAYYELQNSLSKENKNTTEEYYLDECIPF